MSISCLLPPAHSLSSYACGINKLLRDYNTSSAIISMIQPLHISKRTSAFCQLW
jgi:hypothetical protein